MKNKILITSAALTLAASFLAIAVTLFFNVQDPQSAVWSMKLMTVASFLGLGSIGLFFVGLAFPKEVK